MNNNVEILLKNINMIHSTPMGIERIRNNLNLKENDIISWCKNIIRLSNTYIIRKGKNYYCNYNNIELTINAYNFCIITAHIKKD